ncbi:hypothetical protein [Myxococcus llanfairpwllgwyngyllgogerychwyrndrobwllllantysiliogogogochensis]|uniref:Lipoprotein n=1 Tax=Myxococcus llanfairpwllgwyngyllgogerychwyrndrobwllllantysiliogogogochensis TaxID=2590453 RepID=A0A540WVK5_9BACT|nr:hypothetical protein [Myxococcus llanfairpwllgwyngyllgogerychwyrndrobwllllantysiliogogogochensis]NTX04649.1 hypothetical protein [Myxococcus sp. CA040A]TQF13041.1 hypothetical protein FJV41_26035 [Myxococcus llanfairpwllgwyngyllgogerychwyrndrobwllllantysiliogogogochensis]
MPRVALALMLLLVAGCSSGVDDVLDAWRAAGESPSAFTDVGEKLPGGKCRAGKVSGLDATVCVFESTEKARQAEEAGWTLVGNAAGAAMVSGKMVLVIADPRKEDPSGRRINALVKAFQGETR